MSIDNVEMHQIPLQKCETKIQIEEGAMTPTRFPEEDGEWPR